MKESIVLIMYTESGIRLDDRVHVNLEWGYSIEFEVVLENAATRLGDQEGVYARNGYGNRNAICRSHIDCFQTVFNIGAQEWINAMACGEYTGSTSWDGYAATSVADIALESQASGGIEINVKMIDKLEFYA